MPELDAPENSANWLLTIVDEILLNSVAEPMQTLFTWIFPLAAIGLTIQYMAYAYMIMQGNGGMTVTEFIKKFINAAIIASFFGIGGFYQTDIVHVLLALPDDLAGITNDISNIGDRVGQMFLKASETANKINESSGSGWFSFLPTGKEVVAAIISLLLMLAATVVGAIITLIMVTCKIGMALVVVFAPFAIAALLFEPTKNVFNSWVQQVLNFAFLALLASLLFSVIIEVYMSFLGVASDSIISNRNLLTVIGGAVLVTIASVFVLLQVPPLAAALSGGFGAQFGVGAAASAGFSAMRIRSMMRMGRGLGRGAGAGAGAGAGKGAGGARRG